MPYRRLPNTITAVIRNLVAARDGWALYPADRLITQVQFDKLDAANPASLLNDLLKESGDVSTALAAQAPLSDAFAKGLARLTLYVSHFHQVYDLAVGRGELTAGGRAYFGREVSATTLPDLSSAKAVLEAAEKIGTGETERQLKEGAAFTPMAMPSAAQVATVYATVKALYQSSRQAQAFTDLQQNELALLYPEAQKLAVSICNTIEFHLGEREGLDAAGQRQIARRWGVVYIYESNETPDPGDTNASNTTLPPTPPSA